MLAQKLKRLANATETAKLDLNPGGLVLAQVDNELLAFYHGAYAACGITVDTEGQQVLSRPVSVSAQELKDLVGLFDDDVQVRLVPGEAGLTIATKTRRASLTYKGSPDYTGYSTLTEVIPNVCVSLQEFKREADIASGVSAVTLSQPILTGIRIIAANTTMGVQASNGTSLLFESAIKAEAGNERFEVVAPAQDLMLGLRMMTGDKLWLARAGNGLVMVGEDSIVKLPVLSGKWPNMASVKPTEFQDHISLPTGMVRTLAIAVRAYRASNDAIIRPNESGMMVLETRDSEMGQFQEVMAGRVTQRYVIDVADLEVAARISDADIDMRFAKARGLATSELRKLYLTLRAQ